MFACGRYEGIDQRVADWAADAGPVSEVSIGDYVLAGGEVAVLVMVEAVTRLLPGVVGNRESVETTRTPTGCSKARPTPGRRRGAGTRCRRSCCPATTPRSPAGGAPSRCGGPPPAVPTCCGPCRPTSLTDAERALLDPDG